MKNKANGPGACLVTEMPREFPMESVHEITHWFEKNEEENVELQRRGKFYHVARWAGEENHRVQEMMLYPPKKDDVIVAFLRQTRQPTLHLLRRPGRAFPAKSQESLTDGSRPSERGQGSSVRNPRRQQDGAGVDQRQGKAKVGGRCRGEGPRTTA